MGDLKHKFRMLLMNEGEDFGEEILVSVLSEKMEEIAEQYAKEKIIDYNKFRCDDECIEHVEHYLKV